MRHTLLGHKGMDRVSNENKISKKYTEDRTPVT